MHSHSPASALNLLGRRNVMRDFAPAPMEVGIHTTAEILVWLTLSGQVRGRKKRLCRSVPDSELTASQFSGWPLPPDRPIKESSTLSRIISLR
jgi:hypothetical protein